MPIESLLTQTATVRPRGNDSNDGEGNAVPQFAAPVEEPCWLEQTDTTEVLTGNVVELSSWRIFLPGDSVIGPKAEVDVAGVPYRVVGEPNVLHHPRRGPHHVEARLAKVR